MGVVGDEARRPPPPPAEAAPAQQLPPEALPRPREIPHVVERVADLFARERTVEPLRELSSLVEVDPEQALDECAVADLISQPDEAGCDLRVHDGPGRDGVAGREQ